MSQKTSVTFDHCAKSFFTLRGKITVFRDVSFTIEPGEFFVLLGPSGCGKSTMLNLTAGLEKPTRGRILFNEDPVADSQQRVFKTPFKRDVAMVFQNYALYPHMNIGQNIAFPLTNRKPKPSGKEIHTRVTETARLLEIESLLDRKPGELSGGQRQRVAIGRAIVRQPRVFLMDEPLSNLDAQLRMSMRAQLKELQRTLGITTIYVTHDQLEAMTLGDRIAVLHKGKIQQIDTSEKVYHNPVNEFVARFIGSPPMNMLTGQLTINEDTACIRIGRQSVTLPPAYASKIESPEKEKCTIGIRPEHIEFSSESEEENVIRTSVNVIENLGSEYLSYVTLEGQTLIVKTNDPPPSGSSIFIRLPNSHITVFDSSGHNLSTER